MREWAWPVAGGFGILTWMLALNIILPLEVAPRYGVVLEWGERVELLLASVGAMAVMILLAAWRALWR